ncbi:hypothetical protein BpHYR1_037577 [Brachionus plicatilis]|uniref:Uncharacterized protein n=1 Tax=Brachionus plicatilis TaxID=10195 RepID=A0A3M7T4M9_BRAPC|nr:hypothetical protein BpHYR1_037577 [Brachionus plicatilis]
MAPRKQNTTGKIASYFGSVCNVLTKNCIDFQNFEKFEVDSVITVSIEANRKKYNLLARLLSKEILNEPPGIIISDIEKPITTENEADRPTFSSVKIKPINEQQNEISTNTANDEPANIRLRIPISKSMDSLSLRDNDQWRSDEKYHQLNSKLDRFAVNYFEKNLEDQQRMTRIEKTVKNMSSKLDILEQYLPYLPKILDAIQSNQGVIKRLEKGPIEMPCSSNDLEENQDIDFEDDDNNEELIFNDELHRNHFKALLINYINRMDKIKKEFPEKISNIKDAFQKECSLKRVHNWQKMWTYAGLVRFGRWFGWFGSVRFGTVRLMVRFGSVRLMVRLIVGFGSLMVRYGAAYDKPHFLHDLQLRIKTK